MAEFEITQTNEWLEIIELLEDRLEPEKIVAASRHSNLEAVRYQAGIHDGYLAAIQFLKELGGEK